MKRPRPTNIKGRRLRLNWAAEALEQACGVDFALPLPLPARGYRGVGVGEATTIARAEVEKVTKMWLEL